MKASSQLLSAAWARRLYAVFSEYNVHSTSEAPRKRFFELAIEQSALMQMVALARTG
jgi:hypothetical protein